MTFRRPPSPAKLNKQVEEFKAEIPQGTAVIVTDDHGQQHNTTTRSEAWVMGGHSAVVLLEGFSGGYLIERVKKA